MRSKSAQSKTQQVKARETKQVLNKLSGSKNSRLGEKRTKATATVETFTANKISK